MALTPQQTIGAQEWNEIIRSNISTAIGAKLPGKFIAANCVPEFYYAFKSTLFNESALKGLNTLLTQSDGVPVIKDIYSDLYKNVIDSLEYGISSEDKKQLNKEEQENEALVDKIINEYKDSQIDDPVQKYPTVAYIIDRLEKVTGCSFLDIDALKYPQLSLLCDSLNDYTRAATFTAEQHKKWRAVYDRINKIKEHISNPTDENGGLKTDSERFYIGWNDIPETTTLLESLKNESNSISISVSADSFSNTESVLHFESDVKVKVPFNWIFNLQVDHEHEFDLSKFSSKEADLKIDLEFKGISTVKAIPMPISSNNKEGWFAADMLKEAAEKSGKDATGIRLSGSRYDPDKLFGENGELRRINTFVISQQPVITLTFSNFECSGFEQYFEQDTNVKFSILGGLVSGTHDNDFSCTSSEYNASSNTLTVKLAPPALGSFGSLGKQTAYVLGGTAEYFPRA